MFAACRMSGHAHASRAGRVCSTCASRVQHVCTTCAPRVHLYFTGISEQWSGQGLSHYYEMKTYLSLQAQIQDVRENTGAHVVHTWCTRGAHALHTCCTRGSSVGRQCVDVGAVGSGAEPQAGRPSSAEASTLHPRLKVFPFRVRIPKPPKTCPCSRCFASFLLQQGTPCGM